MRSSSTVTMWESGERVPKSEILPRLSAELGCTIDELYGLDPPKQEANRPGAQPKQNEGKEILHEVDPSF